MTYIGEFAFEDCQNLSVINILAQTPPSLGTDAFKFTAENFRIYVPRESVDAYKAAYPDLADRIKPIMGDHGTGISLTSAPSPKRGEEWYDLSGRKMINGQWPKGVYIINGKKVVIK